ncbi:DUF4153 domain-containing protein [Enterococcus wangshanyuanii]|uniref:DUF4173 domain-containing protein n=1 Tax=Enterococcus wangshanyuanii TaxID=2005703 RepID=A0ABQ1PV74_9ENTE|nr:DUF4173 domain-containing protein [Enterococcus wangshanyuanii]GGD03884.1 hypothetical protein GCM10011573_36720 [Enterococcus wangshanyuanii]
MNESEDFFEELHSKNEIKSSEKPVKSTQFNTKDLIFNLFSIAITFFTLKMFISEAGGIWVTLLTICFCVGVCVYAKIQKITMKKASYVYLLYNLLLGLSFAIFENTIFLGMNLFFLVLSCSYWIMTLGDARTTKTLDSHIIYDLFFGIVVRPFKNLSESFSVYSVARSDKKNKNVRYVVIGLMFSLPVLLLVITLLSSADALFGDWMFNILSYLSENLKSNILIFLFSIPLGYYLFLYVYRNMICLNKSSKTKKRFKGPDAMFITILTVFILVYLIFFVSTIMNFSAFLQKPITASTVSEYARTGFFQLVFVSLINIGIFTLIKIVGNEKNRGIIVLLSIIGVETLGLIFLGFAKMQLYISQFGLTLMRFNTSAFMLVLFICVCLFITALWKQFNYIRWVVVIIAFSFLGISYQNAGRFIASYNYKKYQQETLYEFDLSVFYSLGADVVPVALKMYQETEDETLKLELEKYFDYMEGQLVEHSNNQISVSRMKAKALIQTYMEEKHDDVQEK